MHHLVQGSLIRHVELLGILLFRLRFAVTTHTCSGSAADLGDSQVKHSLPALFAFPCGNDHTCIRHCNSDTGNQFSEDVIINAVIKRRGVYIVRMFHSRNTDGVRSHTMDSFQMLCMHKKPRKFIAVHLQPEQYPKTYIVDTAFHSSVHGLCVIIVIALGACGMKLFVALFVVGFLEENVGANAGIFQFSVILHCGGGNIYVYTADRPVFMFDAVNGFDALQYVFNGIVLRILARFQG